MSVKCKILYITLLVVTHYVLKSTQQIVQREKLCYLTPNQRELVCNNERSDNDISLGITSITSFTDGRIEIVIGDDDYRTASQIRADGLNYFQKKYADKSIHLELKLKINITSAVPLRAVSKLKSLKLYSFFKHFIDPCVFLDESLSHHLQTIDITCMPGMTSEPFSFLWSNKNVAKKLILRTCGTHSKCTQCKNKEGLREVSMEAKVSFHVRKKTIDLIDCSWGECSHHLFRQCSRQSITLASATMMITTGLPSILNKITNNFRPPASCRDDCYLTSTKKELVCDNNRSNEDTHVQCLITLYHEGGLLITIGDDDYRTASQIRADGLVYFQMKYPDKPIYLELKFKISITSAVPLRALSKLKSLKLHRFFKRFIEPCVFVDRSLSQHLQTIDITCMGPMTWEPLSFLWSNKNVAKKLILRTCGTHPKCTKCEGIEGLSEVSVVKEFPYLLAKERTNSLKCPRKNCSDELINQCFIKPTPSVSTTKQNNHHITGSKVKNDKDNYRMKKLTTTTTALPSTPNRSVTDVVAPITTKETPTIGSSISLRPAEKNQIIKEDNIEKRIVLVTSTYSTKPVTKLPTTDKSSTSSKFENHTNNKDPVHQQVDEEKKINRRNGGRRGTNCGGGHKIRVAIFSAITLFLLL